jgi:hypothetical protein
VEQQRGRVAIVLIILLAARLMRMPSIMTDNQEFAKVVELDRDHNGNGEPV